VIAGIIFLQYYITGNYAAIICCCVTREYRAQILKIFKVGAMPVSVNNQTQSRDAQGQYVTFRIGDETYGIDVGRAQEVLNMTGITRVPNTMPFMKGVMDLRGKIVPLVDMRIKFSLPEKDYDKSTVIIIVQVRGLIIGMIVDSVSDVINMTSAEIQNTPHFTREIERDSVVGISRVNGELIIVLDVDSILTEQEIAQIGETRG